MTIIQEINALKDIVSRLIRRQIGSGGGDESAPIFLDMNEPTGFVDNTDSAIFWSDTGPDRTFTIDKTNGTFDYYIKGVKYTIAGAKTCQISDDEGLHYIYFDTDEVLHDTIVWNRNLLLDYAIVSIVYWNTTDNEAIHVADERHKITMDGRTHLWLHYFHGAIWRSGLALDGFTIGDGSLDVHAQCGYGSGIFYDEDLRFEIAADTSPATIPVFYKSGAAGDWKKDTAINFPMKNTVAGRVNWNGEVVGDWQQVQTTDGKFMLTHIFAINEGINEMVIVIQGQAEYGTIANARKGATTELVNLVLTGMPLPEMVPLATIIIQTKDTYANAVKAKFVQTDEGDNYIDWRTTKITTSQIGSVSDHGSLGGLSDDDHLQYLLISGVRAMIGALDMGNQNIINPGTGHDAFTDYVANKHVIEHISDIAPGGGDGANGDLWFEY